MQPKQNKLKTGILISMLIVPVLLFLFFYTLGDNEYNLPVYYATDSTKKGPGYEITGAQSIPDFTLINQDGETIRGHDYKNQIYIVDFFSSQCRDVCPIMSNEIARAQEEFKEDKQVRFLSITIDPAHDTVAVLKKYSQEYRAVKGKWNFATGTPEHIQSLIKTNFRIAGTDTLGQLEAHAHHLVLIDKDGWVRGYYAGSNLNEIQRSVERLITEVYILEDYYSRHNR